MPDSGGCCRVDEGTTQSIHDKYSFTVFKIQHGKAVNSLVKPIPSLFSLRHLLVLSLALNVSLILRAVYHESGEDIKWFRFKKKLMADAESCLAISSTSSPVNSTREKVINLDHVVWARLLTSCICVLLSAQVPGKDRDKS
ncbi:unnamed protein product [Sphenostylis stenocarpa]|uniref:Uncharacterized protein n=1 Tax=Sphenostylis stenocarpa TaxID=92480 RepID=A0AA86VKT3_9FABA|nr:unnamed protein product [Sphenostylis stenocarpa]